MSDSETAIELSKRELQVLEMVATGASNQQIASQLVISVNTVKVHLRNIFEKLDVQSRTEASLRAIQEGWITVNDEPPSVEDSAPPKTFLLAADGPPVTLDQWQQIYLLLAILLTLAVTVIPLLPRTPPKTSPDLPVIYAQSPTPVAPNNGSSIWRTQVPMPTKRAGLGLVAFNKQIFAIGGVRSNNKATRSVEIYDPGANSWSEGAAKPTAAANILGVVLKDKIYVPGGCTNDGQAIEALEIYDPRTDSWEQGAALPEPRCGYGLVVFDDELYLFGGWDGQAFEDTIMVFSPQENAWEVLDSALPQAKGYLGAAAFDDTIYVVGGYDGENEFDHTHEFVPETGEWIERASMHKKRGGLQLVSTTTNLFAIGGGWNQALNTNEKYDPEEDEWTTFEAPFSHQWRNMGLATIDTNIYAVGGWDGTDEQYMDSVVSYQFLFQIFLPVNITE